MTARVESFRVQLTKPYAWCDHLELEFLCIFWMDVQDRSWRLWSLFGWSNTVAVLTPETHKKRHRRVNPLTTLANPITIEIPTQ